MGKSFDIILPQCVEAFKQHGPMTGTEVMDKVGLSRNMAGPVINKLFNHTVHVVGYKDVDASSRSRKVAIYDLLSLGQKPSGLPIKHVLTKTQPIETCPQQGRVIRLIDKKRPDMGTDYINPWRCGFAS